MEVSPNLNAAKIMDKTKDEDNTYDYPINPVYAMSCNFQNGDGTKPEVPLDEKSVPSQNNSSKYSTVALIFVLGVIFLLAFCGVLIRILALPSSQSTPIKDMSSEVLKLQESLTSVSKMIEAVNGTMYVQLHLLDEKILETHTVIQNDTGTPGIYMIYSSDYCT